MISEFLLFLLLFFSVCMSNRFPKYSRMLVDTEMNVTVIKGANVLKSKYIPNIWKCKQGNHDLNDFFRHLFSRVKTFCNLVVIFIIKVVLVNWYLWIFWYKCLQRSISTEARKNFCCREDKRLKYTSWCCSVFCASDRSTQFVLLLQHSL